MLVTDALMNLGRVESEMSIDSVRASRPAEVLPASELGY